MDYCTVFVHILAANYVHDTYATCTILLHFHELNLFKTSIDRLLSLDTFLINHRYINALLDTSLMNHRFITALLGTSLAYIASYLLKIWLNYVYSYIIGLK